jgi:YesN/AraC family two-component response regulator
LAKRILVADDEELVRKTIYLILKDEYDIEVASGGEEALEKALKNDYDLLLVDLKMPDKNGAEVIRSVKKKKPDVKAAIITGYYERYKSLIEEVSPLIVGVVRKPLEMEEFREKVREFFSS